MTCRHRRHLGVLMRVNLGVIAVLTANAVTAFATSDTTIDIVTSCIAVAGLATSGVLAYLAFGCRHQAGCTE